MDQNDLKRAAARAALAHLETGAVVGVGSGSTVNFFIDELGAVREHFMGAVASSEASARRLREHGVDVFDLNHALAAGWPLPVYVDGADEVDAGLRMIKGGGGALTREKIVSSAFARFVCIVDASKVVARLGRYPLPVEVIPMARELVAHRLRTLGGEPRVRADFVTDNGNLILDVAGLAIDDPAAMEDEINQWPGVVTVGLFAERPADVALVASPEGIRTLHPA